MSYIPVAVNRPRELKKSTLSLKIKITQLLAAFAKSFTEDTSPSANFAFHEVREKWETMARPPTKNDFLDFIFRIDNIADILIGENDLHNAPLTDEVYEFKDKCLLLGVNYYGGNLERALREYISDKNYATVDMG